MVVALLVALLLSVILIGFSAVFELRARDLQIESYRNRLAVAQVKNENLEAFVRRATERGRHE
jgi:hypothetical protein